MSDKTKKKNPGLLIIVAAFAIIFCVNVFKGSAKIDWADSIDSAISSASKGDKPAMLLFTTDQKSSEYYSESDRFNYATLTKDGIVKYINKNFYAVKVVDDKEMQAKYKVKELPSIVLIGSSGDKITLEGFISEKEFISRVSGAVDKLNEK